MELVTGSYLPKVTVSLLQPGLEPKDWIMLSLLQGGTEDSLFLPGSEL